MKKFSRKLRNPRLTDNQDIRSKLNHPETFLGFGGDEYVDEESFGGELYIVFSSEANYKSEKTTNQQKLGAAVGFLSLGGSANIQKAINEIQSTLRLDIKLYQNGGTPFDKDTVTLDKLFEFALKFPSTVKTTYSNLDYLTKQYQFISNFPEGYQGDTNVENDLAYMNKLVVKLLKIGTAVGDVGFVGRNVGLFRPAFADSAWGVSEYLARRVDSLQACANRCHNLYSQNRCSTCQALNSPDLIFPVELSNAPPAP